MDHWKAILLLGEVVDQRLSQGELRLTMGGEPTFVADDDFESAEWRTTAIGEDKRKRAEILLWRLKDRFTSGALVQVGIGKWYPQEPEPRWAFGISWRRDGQPLWTEATLLSNGSKQSSSTIDDAQKLCHAIAKNLHLKPDNVHAAYEEPPHIVYAGKKQSLNIGKLEQVLEGNFDAQFHPQELRHLGANPVAYVLPLRTAQTETGQTVWISEIWMKEETDVYLIPGDSPAGLRLPLDALPELDPEDYPHIVSIDPSEAPQKLPSRETLLNRMKNTENLQGHVRTALVVEPRDGRLYVFMPPVSDAEEFASLTAFIEEAAKATGRPICFEGYAPPIEPRLSYLTVTPDPGVLEVNVHPARNWKEAVDIISGVYEDASNSGLTTYKHLQDGRRVGTGGGSHIVLGAERPIDSPFLRKPDLLKSVITYWQNHPSLSYLFSGLFVGPTSQAPRIDEARQEILYELEIAFQRISQDDSEPQSFEESGGFFRHLLVDVTGNTHRAEICADKLWGYDGGTGRQGLIEFRGFEMPPHVSMSLLEWLLIRAIIVTLWERPYTKDLIRWGATLHDKFMLPHFIWQDFKTVVADLNAAGFSFEETWFRHQYDFRFPRICEINCGNANLEVRTALEPWNVLAEDNSNGSTSRPVDDSVERLQICMTGYDSNRHLVTCNGIPLSFCVPDGSDQAIVGVRFCARQHYASLHPGMKVHAPITIEVFDLQNGGLLGGCRYHSEPPGKPRYQTLPKSDDEAAQRRRERLEIFAPAPNKQVPKIKPMAQESQHTFDLRQIIL